jgi:hypothetical protein
MFAAISSKKMFSAFVSMSAHKLDQKFPINRELLDYWEGGGESVIEKFNPF